MTNKISEFMQSNFNNIPLRLPLFYNWDNSLRFEISNLQIEHESKENMNQMEERSCGIFDRVFHEDDEILFVTDVTCSEYDNLLNKKPMKVYQKYVKDKSVRQKLQYHFSIYTEYEDIFEEYQKWATHHFSLACKKEDIRYKQLFRAITYDEFSHPSRILNGFPSHRYSVNVYFINVSKRIIYHLYNDLGCDVIASNKEDLRPLYYELNDWILDYDREKIDKIFKN